MLDEKPVDAPVRVRLFARDLARRLGLHRGPWAEPSRDVIERETLKLLEELGREE